VLFNSYVFIFAFLPAVLGVYLLVRRHAERPWAIAWLVLASFVYYAYWNPLFLLLLAGSILVNYALGSLLCSGRLRAGAARRAVLVGGLAFNLGVLAYFKYAAFFVDNLNRLSGAGLPLPQILLPIGISFITFQKIAFLVDAYRGQVRDFSFANFALFVSFFPQLIAGPIVHHSEVMPQFARVPPAGSVAADLSVGFSIFCVGLFKKVVVADTCALFADAGYGMLKAGQPLDAASAWVAVLAYAFQLYYDFSGYSDMAIGLARMFGIRLPVNFDSPYKASGAIDFWRRWHITLSRFLRDYLYIPLGGNRRGALRQYLNVTVVMLLGGLWHGANWTFVVWGGVHGMLLAINHAWNRLAGGAVRSSALTRGAAVVLTFLAVTLAWVPFRAGSLHEAGRMLALLDPFSFDAWISFRTFLHAQLNQPFNVSGWFRPRELWPAYLPPDFLAAYKPAGLFLGLVAACSFLLPNTQQLFARFEPVLGVASEALRHRASLLRLDWKIAGVVSALFVFSVLHLTKVSPFLYFQF
jgi:D-alanyl-lipoteichoic acid acyltransferase DltB (MBOAT superfamily)